MENLGFGRCRCAATAGGRQPRCHEQRGAKVKEAWAAAAVGEAHGEAVQRLHIEGWIQSQCRGNAHSVLTCLNNSPRNQDDAITDPWEVLDGLEIRN